MSRTIACPACGRRLLLPADVAASTARCPACAAQFEVDAAAAPEPPADAVVRGEGIPPRLPGPRGADGPRSLFPQALGPVGEVRLRKPRRRGRLALAAVLGAGLFLAFGACVGLWSLRPAPRPARPPVVPDFAGEREDVRAAFREGAGAGADDRTRELNALLESLGAAMRARDENRLAGLFDVERMFDELAARGMLPPAFLRDRRSFVTGMRIGVGRSLAQQAVLLQWTTFEIKNVKDLGGGDAAVIVRHTDADGTRLKMRWWVTRRAGGWKFYDLEDLDVGMRFSTTAGSLLGRGAGQLPGIARASAGIREAIVALSRNDADAADRQLRQIAATQLPPQLDAVRLLAVGMLHLQRDKGQEALDSFARARALQPDMPILDLLQGTALNSLGRPAEALKHLEAYRDLLGEEEPVCLQLGEALRNLRRFDEAAKCYRTTLRFNPKNADAFLGLLYSLGADDPRDDVPAHFARLDNHRENFVACADALKEVQDGAGIEQLAGAMRRLDPNFDAVDRYLALARAWKGEADEAVKLFRAALAREKEGQKRSEHTREFLLAMLRAGKALEGYAAAPDADEAFRTLAAGLLGSPAFAPLKGLVEAHEKKRPADPLLPFYRGAWHAKEGDYPRAEKAFAAGMARPPDGPTLGGFRETRVTARYYTGRGLSAYREIGPRAETFRQLADLCLAERDAALLRTLLAEEAKAEPAGPDLARYGCRLKARQGQAAEAAALFRSALGKLKQPEERRRFAGEFLADMAEAGHALEAYRAAPDARQAFRTLAEEMVEDRAFGKLRELLAAHRARSPDDPWLAAYEAELHQEDGAWDKAAAVLGPAWKSAPKEVREQLRWRYVHALYKAGRAMQAHREVDPAEDTFDQLADLLAADGKGKELEALVAAHKARVGEEDADLLHHRARAKALQGQVAEAAALLRQARDKEAGAPRPRAWVHEFVRDLEAKGRGLEAYRAAPDQEAAFASLAAALTAHKKAKELGQLLEEHAKRPAGGVALLRYRGELHLLRGEPAEAEKQFAAALERATPAERYSAQAGLNRARARAGTVLAAYKKLGPGSFEELANACLAEKSAGQLEALLAAHRKARPKELGLSVRELELRWLKGDHAAALRLLEEDPEGLFGLPRFSWRREDYRVRALVRLKRADEAVREVEARYRPRRGQALLVVLAHAARGGADEALTAAAKLPGGELHVPLLYGDPDLGPLLRGEAFRAFRAKYPPPKEDNEADR